MSRRARRRQAGHVAMNAVEIAINRARKLSTEDVVRQHRITTHALDEFSRGNNCPLHWNSLADAANMAETLAGMGLGSGADADRVISDAQHAQHALHDVHQRHTQRGTWTLYADEIDALRWLVTLHCTVQLSACSYGEFCDAYERTHNRMQQALAGNAPAGALVITGGIGPNAQATAP